jgi:hypothetical protein
MFGAVGLGGLEVLLLVGVVGLFSLLCLAFWIWMLIDCIRNRGLSDNERIVWVLVIVFTHAIGALIYLLAGRKPMS